MLLKIAFSFLKPTPLYDETRATPHSPRFRKAFYASVRRATLLTLPSHQRQAYPLADRTILHGYYTTLVSFVNICGAWSAVWLCADANVRSNCKAFRAHNITISEAQKEAQEAQKPLPLPFLLLLYLLLKCKVFSLYTCKRILLY